jgi:amphi-Trp domain-containing protein
MSERDVEVVTNVNEFVAKLRRLADALESGESFRIQIAGERFRVPKHASLSVEHERDSDSEEVEFQLKWSHDVEEEGDDDAVV